MSTLNPAPQAPQDKKKTMRSLFFAGLLPVIAFTVIEEYYGTAWGIVAGMVFGVGEIIWEWRTQGKVAGITWGGNALILMLGGLSLIANDGIWFKLQPALIETVMAVILIGTTLAGKSLLLSLAEKQGQQFPPAFQRFVPGMSVRIGLFFLAHAALATWAALRWSTTAWALLKGVGFTVSFMVYMVIEALVLRKRLLSLKSPIVETEN